MKPKNWGQVKGGKNSTGNTKRISMPNPSEELAEFFGIVLGDGNVESYKKGKKIRAYSVKIAGDSLNDYEYLVNYVFVLSKKLFNIEPKIYFSKRSRCAYVVLHGVMLVKYLEKMGLTSGNKIKNQVTIPSWIWEKEEYLKSCIRGLIDTDGSVYELLPNWPGLFQISFDNNNIRLLEDTRKALIHLGFNVSKISKKGDYGGRIYLTRKDQIKKFYEEIGLNNPKHSKKLACVSWLSPVV